MEAQARLNRRFKLTKGRKALISCIAFLFFAVVAYAMMAEKNAVYLYAVQERSSFINEWSFFLDKMMYAGGLSQWLGCYFTQFFYYPGIGTLMLIAFWAILFYLIHRAFRISALWSVVALIPLFVLLVSVIDLGYWLYYLKSPGYWFTQTICVIAMTAGIWLCTPRERETSTHAGTVLKYVAIPLWTAVAYPLIGAWALIGTFWMAAKYWMEARRANLRVDYIVPGIAAACIAVTPLFYYQYYTRMRLEDAWRVNIPLFQDSNYTSYVMTVPFIIVALMPCVFLLIHWKENEPKQDYTPRQATVWGFANVAILIACAVLVPYFAYDNYNYNAELRMYRAIDESRFEDVLTEAAKAPGPMTRQMVIAKNIALMNTGEIGNKMFHYDNSGEPPYVRDSLHVHMVQTAGPQIYYNYGRANFACRWAIENGVEYGYSIDNLKTLTRAAMISGERKVALKYINILRNTTFHKEWAEEWERMLNNSALYHQHPEYKNIHPLRGFKDVIDGDEGLVEMYIISYFSHVQKHEPKFQEETLLYSLVQKDIQLFWQRFFQYASLHENEPMPIHYQEAAYLYGHLENEVDISKMPFDQERIVQRYANFQQVSQSLLNNGMSTEKVGETLKATYGDTFWWFYFFCRDIHSY